MSARFAAAGIGKYVQCFGDYKVFLSKQSCLKFGNDKAFSKNMSKVSFFALLALFAISSLSNLSILPRRKFESWTDREYDRSILYSLVYPHISVFFLAAFRFFYFKASGIAPKFQSLNVSESYQQRSHFQAFLERFFVLISLLNILETWQKPNLKDLFIFNFLEYE